MELRARGRRAAPPLRQGRPRRSGSPSATSTGIGRSITSKFATTPLGTPLPIEQTSYWKSLPEEQRWEVTRRTAAFRLSNFLHGEQGALMVAAQLVNAVPHTDAKFYAATQTMDEARHVEVFAQVHQEARRGAADRAAAEAHARRHAADRRLDEEAGRHADRRRGAGALQLPRDAQPDRGAAAQGPADLRRARRVAPPRLRRAVHRALRAVPAATPSAPSSRTSRSRPRAR